MKKARRYDAGDVLVIGAGASGVLTAIRLAKLGFQVTLVDKDGLGAMQSNHSHGYLHQGYIYLSGTSALIEHLRRGAASWRELFQSYDLAPVVSRSQIAFSNTLAERAAVAYWRKAGLAIDPEQPHPVLVGTDINAYGTAEPSYDFSEMFAALRDRLTGVHLVPCAIEELLVEDSHVTGARGTAPDGGAVTLQARRYVLAAGVDNEKLISRATNFRGRAYSRTSYMLVLKSRHLPLISFINPENEAYGIFVSSRRERDRVVWLVSNFLSYARLAHSPEAGRLWVTATLRTLEKLTRVLELPDIEMALYTAPKMELRPRPGILSAHAVEDYGLGNVLVVAPTKLTLAPVLAAQISETIGSLRVASVPSGARPVAEVAGKLDPRPEWWQTKHTEKRGEFMSRITAATGGT